MPKSRTRHKTKIRQKVYTHQRERKQGKGITPTIIIDQLNGVIKHSEEILKLKIEISYTKKKIAMLARNRDIMDHFINDEKNHLEWFANKIDEHVNACIKKMKLFLGNAAENLQIPEDFHLGSTDLKNGYVSLENKKGELMSVILTTPAAEFPLDNIKIGTVILHDEDKIQKLKLNSLLKNVDVISTILLRKASILEGISTNDPTWYCQSVNCLERKPKINFGNI